jgi:putative flippase GtrA
VILNLDIILSYINNNKYLKKILDEKMIQQLKRYITVGLITVGAEYFNLFLFKEVFNMWYIYANSIAYTISFVFNFSLNRTWTFKSTADLKRQLLIYGILFIFNFFASNLIMYLFTDIIGLNYLISKLFAVGMVVSWNFIIYKKVIYKS